MLVLTAMSFAVAMTFIDQTRIRGEKIDLTFRESDPGAKVVITTRSRYTANRSPAGEFWTRTLAPALNRVPRRTRSPVKAGPGRARSGVAGEYDGGASPSPSAGIFPASRLGRRGASTVWSAPCQRVRSRAHAPRIYRGTRSVGRPNCLRRPGWAWAGRHGHDRGLCGRRPVVVSAGRSRRCRCG